MEEAGDSIISKNANWSFDGNVSENFDKHINRSVPLYEEGHQLIEKISDFYLNDGSLCYDIGCSTGTLAKRLAKRHYDKNVKIIGLDQEGAMIEKAKEGDSQGKNLEFEVADILNIELESADLIVCYYTMQFIKPKHRQMLFDKIYKALNWGGAFVLFEKVRGPDARFQDMATTIYTDYKLNQGYTPDEIVAKTKSLKGVLEPFSSQANMDLMKRAGFVDMMTIMKYVCFEGFLAIK